MGKEQSYILAGSPYAAVGLVALGVGSLQGRWDLLRHPNPYLSLSRPWCILSSVIVGTVLGFAGAWLSRHLMRHFHWAKQLAGELSEAGSRSRAHCLVLACAAGVSEELLFRGALQPVCGIVFSALIFGIVHIGPTFAHRVWIVGAFAWGIMSSWLFALTGELWGPILAHVILNYLNLTFVGASSEHATRLLIPRRARLGG